MYICTYVQVFGDVCGYLFAGNLFTQRLDCGGVYCFIVRLYIVLKLVRALNRIMVLNNRILTKPCLKIKDRGLNPDDSLLTN